MSVSFSSRFDAWLSRRHGVQRTAVTLDRRRIYILPTGAGWAFIGAQLIMLLWAINYNNSLAYGFTFLLGALMLNAMWRTHNGLLDLTVRALPASDPELLFAGCQARFRYALDHPDGGRRYGVGLQWRKQPPVYADVAAGGAEVNLVLPALARGWLRPGRLRISNRFPLGLFEAWSWVTFDQARLVYPEPRGDRPLPDGSDDGRTAAVRPRQSTAAGQDDFAGLRGYVAGDSPRRVAWRASAKTDYATLQVKQFSAETQTELWLDWHTLPLSDPETRLSQLCRWVLDAAAGGRRFGLRLPGQELPPDGGDTQRRRCLSALALYGTETDAPAD